MEPIRTKLLCKSGILTLISENTSLIGIAEALIYFPLPVLTLFLIVYNAIYS